ncbi:MAG: peroxiredoxin family protein [Isosphaeraceae bacterium]
MIVLIHAILAVAVASAEPGDSPRETPERQYQNLIDRHNLPARVYQSDPVKAKEAMVPFLELARSHPQSPVALDALDWVVHRSLFTPWAGEAMDLLGADHVQDRRFGALLSKLDVLYGGYFPPLERLFRTVVDQSPDRDVRAKGLGALGRHLMQRREEIETNRLMATLAQRGAKVPYFLMPPETDADLKRISEEAERALERAIVEFGDSNALADKARRDLFRVRHLVPGRMAPEIEGRDLDGKTFRLSDHRGKVVVLDFWSHEHCGVCRMMYPELRALVERMKDKPFALIGINSGDSDASLAELRAKGVVTWRFWVDGGGEPGPIHQLWDVGGWPTVYVIDHKGVIRHRSIDGVALDEAVADLVKEASQPSR